MKKKNKITVAKMKFVGIWKCYFFVFTSFILRIDSEFKAFGIKENLIYVNVSQKFKTA